MTAMHLPRPGGGLQEAMEPDDIRHGVSRAELTGFGRGAKHMLFEARQPTPDEAHACQAGPADARRGRRGGVHRAGTPGLRRPCSSRLRPSPGQHVTLLAEVLAPANAGLRHDAVVLGLHDGFLDVQVRRPLNLRATSGAPVVDDAGRVVAINLSAGHTLRSDRRAAVVGGGNPVAAWGDAVGASAGRAEPAGNGRRDLGLHPAIGCNRQYLHPNRSLGSPPCTSRSQAPTCACSARCTWFRPARWPCRPGRSRPTTGARRSCTSIRRFDAADGAAADRPLSSVLGADTWRRVIEAVSSVGQRKRPARRI